MCGVLEYLNAPTSRVAYDKLIALLSTKGAPAALRALWFRG